jgi:hypothetical protein
MVNRSERNRTRGGKTDKGSGKNSRTILCNEARLVVTVGFMCQRMNV